MDRGMKKWIYWGVYVFLTLAGFLACIFRLLPVVTPSVFLLGLYNLWQGVAWALQLYPYSPSTTLAGGSSCFPPPASAWASFGSPSPSPPGPPNGAP